MKTKAKSETKTETKTKTKRRVFRFRVKAPLGAVIDFHRHSSSLKAITPPWTPLSGVSAPEVLAEGDEMEFTLWAGPLPIRWKARIAAVSEDGFVDEQVSGPFELWRHRHRFFAADEAADTESSTWVEDTIEARLPRHLFWGLIGRFMWLGLPIVFAYRARKTRSVLGRLTPSP